MSESAQELEQRMARLTVQRVRIDGELAESSIYADGNKLKLKELLLEQAKLQQELNAAEDTWLAASALLEEAEHD